MQNVVSEDRLTEPTELTSPFPTWLTIESVLYGLIVIAALGLRLWEIGYYPLTNLEAEQSLVALHLYRGETPTASVYSPLLVSLNLWLFVLFGATDVTARLANLLLGLGLVILPMTLRRQLGQKTCLVASALLAISPIALHLSRTVNGELGVAVGSLMIVAGFFNWAADRHPAWLWLLAAGGAILLTAGPLSYAIIIIFSLLIAAGLGLFFHFSTEEAILWAKSLARPDEVTVRLSKPATEKSTDSTKKGKTASKGSSQLSPEWQSAGILFLILLAVIATAATLNFSGFGVLTSFPLTWLGYYINPGETAVVGFNALFLLAIYEPLILLFGLVGLGYAMLRSNLLGLMFGGWFVGLLVLDVIMPGRPSGAVILPLIPLTFLAASALAWVWASLEARGSWANEGLLIAAGVVLAIFGYIGLAGWLNRACPPDDQLCHYAWLQAVAALVLLLTIAGLFAYLSEVGVALRGLGVTVTLVGLCLTINSGSRLNYGPLMDLAYQPLAGVPASTEFVALINTIERQSEERAYGENLMPLTLVGEPSPALQWALRDFPHLTQVSSVTEAPTTPAIITSGNSEEDKAAALGEDYIGQSFAVESYWSPAYLSGKSLLKWLIYHEAPERPQGNQVVLWLRLD